MTFYYWTWKPWPFFEDTSKIFSKFTGSGFCFNSDFSWKEKQRQGSETRPLQEVIRIRSCFILVGKDSKWKQPKHATRGAWFSKGPIRNRTERKQKLKLGSYRLQTNFSFLGAYFLETRPLNLMVNRDPCFAFVDLNLIGWPKLSIQHIFTAQNHSKAEGWHVPYMSWTWQSIGWISAKTCCTEAFCSLHSLKKTCET